MRPCRLALTLFFFPLALGGLIALAVANTWLTALEDARRQRREDAVTRETAWLIRDTHERGPVIETVYDGGEIGVN